MTTRLFTIEGASLDFDASVPCILSTFTGFILSKDFRALCEEGLIQIKANVAEHGKIAWITDLTKSEIFNDDDVKWVSEYWNPNAHENGILYYALVLPQSTFTAINLEEYMEAHKQSKDPLVINLFPDVEAAVEWCKAMLER
ncbi:hypothetical protein [Ohtaekwangia koreensis]|uniref:SpoIIAA-like n=1 Tax=Ohtaekwangia koreensis TaxID=688867 RepID=A0A1T5J049_9BACT|nr:hypothetical protein [Ohtaekwangia koreensis]SKC44573.1 hypothetical protein SAMN05660236_0568 [Ohtaekwangia koreensis]